jgi:hypothetical protein
VQSNRNTLIIVAENTQNNQFPIDIQQSASISTCHILCVRSHLRQPTFLDPDAATPRDSFTRSPPCLAAVCECRPATAETEVHPGFLLTPDPSREDCGATSEVSRICSLEASGEKVPTNIKDSKEPSQMALQFGPHTKPPSLIIDKPIATQSSHQ